MTNEITTFTQEQKSILLETKCKGVRTEDFMFMLELAKKYQLDPFASQIYCTKVGIIISRDGYLAIAHRSGQFDGIKTEFQHDENGNPTVATTTVWRKDISHPFIESAYWSDQNKGTDVWNKYKHDMLQKCSERKALTRAFCITGLYSDAELDAPEPVPSRIVDEDCIDVEAIQVQPEPVKPTPTPKKEPVKNYTCNTVTKEEVNLRLIPAYQRQGFQLGVFADADLGDGKFNKDMIDADFRKQAGISAPAPAPEPESHGEDGLQKFTAEIVADAERERKLKEAQKGVVENIISSASKQTKPSATLSGDVCEVCGCKLLEYDMNICKLFTPGHLFCEAHRNEYINSKAKGGSQ